METTQNDKLEQIIEDMKRVANYLKQTNAKQQKAQESTSPRNVRLVIKATSPHLFVQVGQLFGKYADKCTFSDNGSQLELSEHFTDKQYERVIIPLCAAFNTTNQGKGQIILNKTKR